MENDFNGDENRKGFQTKVHSYNRPLLEIEHPLRKRRSHYLRISTLEEIGGASI
jgi:hypothetical protein